MTTPTWKIADDGNFITESTGYGDAVQVQYTEATERLEELLRIRLLTVLGEDFYSQDLGVPYSSIMGIYDPSFIQAEILRTILADPEVDSVEELEVDLEDPLKRRVTVYVRVKGIQNNSATLEVTL